MDPTRTLGRGALHGGARSRSSPRAPPRSRRCCARATVLSCAEAVGGIQRTVEMSVEYGKVRHQFDKPIGSFQAVKHRCCRHGGTRRGGALRDHYAIVSVRDAAADQDFQVSVAKILCSGAYLQNSADNVQNHGGMGFTWECDAHLYVKRARSFDVAFGSRLHKLDQLAAGFRGA